MAQSGSGVGWRQAVSDLFFPLILLPLGVHPSYWLSVPAHCSEGQDLQPMNYLDCDGFLAALPTCTHVPLSESCYLDTLERSFSSLQLYMCLVCLLCPSASFLSAIIACSGIESTLSLRRSLAISLRLYSKTPGSSAPALSCLRTDCRTSVRTFCRRLNL